ncbi:MAG TPA: S8 family serine peptidase [Candidatus Xenobia bacterium]
MILQSTRSTPPAPAASHAIAGTDLVYDDDDVSNDGRLAFMVSVENQKQLDALRRQLGKDKSTHIVGSLSPVPGLIAEVPVAQASDFVHGLPKHTHVFVDTTIDFDDGDAANVPGHSAKPHTSPWPVDVDRKVMGLDQVWKDGYTGQGVTVAVIDSGLVVGPDLKHAYKGFVDMEKGKKEPFDDFGHGTHIAGLIAGDGTRSHHRILGAAPDAGIVGVRITTEDEAIAGLRWVMANKNKLGIRVVNMSLGETATVPWQKDVWAQACEDAIKAGLIVVVAAGDEGPTAGTIDTPGYDPNVITVGALDDHHSTDHAQHAVYDDSSRGPTLGGLHKPDVLAPGALVWGPLVVGSKKDQADKPHIGSSYIALSGSSQSTALVSGLIADILQANPSLTQAQVLSILRGTADPYLKDGPDAQGAGVVNGPAAIKAALALRQQS